MEAAFWGIFSILRRNLADFLQFSKSLILKQWNFRSLLVAGCEFHGASVDPCEPGILS